VPDAFAAKIEPTTAEERSRVSRGIQETAGVHCKSIPAQEMSAVLAAN
jgi:hypothetical protein